MRNEEVTKHYSLKILFGPMFGCELYLPADDYFIIINPGVTLLDKNIELETERDHAVHYASNTLYIPCDISSPNITLFLSDPTIDGEHLYFNIEVHDEQGNCRKSSFKSNDIFTHEHIKIAVKCSDDVWSPDIKNHHLMPSLTASGYDSTRRKIRNKKILATFCTVFFVFLVIGLLSFFSYYKVSSDKQLISLSEVFSGAPGSLEIVKGHNDKYIYILAQNFQDMEWAKEAVNKLSEHNNLIPVLLSNSKKNIITELYNTGYPVLQLDFSSPTHPVLTMYRTLSSDDELALKNIVFEKIPFAHSIDFNIKTKEHLINEARQGLERLNIHYRQINMNDGYSLVVRDALNDNTLNALRNFIHKFDQQWGSTVITFSINLDENWLQNKSYVDSSSGYLFLNPRHWYFPLKNKEF